MLWATLGTLIVLLATAIVGVLQLRILQRQHRIETAPFIEVNLEFAKDSRPAGSNSQDIIEIPELSEWSDAHPRAANRFMSLELRNRQSNIAGVATEVSFRLIFRFPKLGTPNTMMEIPRLVKGSIWLAPEESFTIIFANLKGLPTGTIDIDKIAYYDIDGNVYHRAFGYCHWELDNTGAQSTDFRALH